MSQAVVIFLIVFTASLKLKRDKHLHGIFFTLLVQHKIQLFYLGCLGIKP